MTVEIRKKNFEYPGLRGHIGISEGREGVVHE